MSITALYGGTFDPITHGHTDIARRAGTLFDRVIVAVAAAGNKQTIFSVDERIEMARAALADHANIEVKGLDTLVTDLARQEGARVLVRGLRAMSDFDHEFQMAGMNRKLFADAETVFLMPAENYNCISSSLVREIVRLGGDVSEFVDPSVERALAERIGK